MTRYALPGAVALIALAACEPLATPNDVSGNFAVEYVNNLRVYIGETLVAEVTDGEDATIEWDGGTFQVSQICDEEGTVCPNESYWGEVAVDQPWGSEYRLLNFVNLDEAHGTLGQRMGGRLEDDASFAMLSGLSIGATGACAAIGVGTVEGEFSPDNTTVENGVVAYTWAAGCIFGEVAIGTTLRLETDFTATRTGDLDLSSIPAAEPIDAEGTEVDPEDPDESYAL